MKITGYSEATFQETFQLIISRINFIDDILISDNDFLEALNLVKSVDENDTMFVALAKHMDIPLWTGDKRLHAALLNKGFKKVISTEEILDLFIEKEYENGKLIH
jgi:predicted nucleic acid-binding protein